MIRTTVVTAGLCLAAVAAPLSTAAQVGRGGVGSGAPHPPPSLLVPPRRPPSPPVPPTGMWLVGLGGLGLVSGGDLEVLGRAALESGLGGPWRLRIAAEGWLGTGDCVTGAPEGSSDLCDASASGWSLGAGPALAASVGRAGLLLSPTIGVAGADGTRFMGGLALAFDPAPAAPVGLRIELAYRRLFGSARPDRLALGAGIRVGIRRP